MEFARDMRPLKAIATVVGVLGLATALEACGSTTQNASPDSPIASDIRAHPGQSAAFDIQWYYSDADGPNSSEMTWYLPNGAYCSAPALNPSDNNGHIPPKLTGAVSCTAPSPTASPSAR